MTRRPPHAPRSFRWDPTWADSALQQPASTRWAHHGIATTTTGLVVTMAARESQVLVLTPDGRLDRTFDVDVTAGHGLTTDRDRNEDVLWLADNGRVQVRQPDGQYATPGGRVTGAVVKVSLYGEELMRLPTPPLSRYTTDDYCPTHVAVDSRSSGGSGDVWVADGYGQNLVHRYSEDGEYLANISGEDGAGPFSRPHAVFIDRRRDVAELYVADRSNARIQVFDLDGAFRRVIGVGHLVSPGGFAVSGSLMYVSELDARVAILDLDDQVIGTIGQAGARDRPGWPNRLDDSGVPVRPGLEPDLFNTPHGIAAGPDGSLYVAEWLIGGRLVRLVPEG